MSAPQSPLRTFAPSAPIASKLSLRRATNLLLSTDHRHIGLGYLALSLVAVAIGTVLSLLMRLHLTWPDRVLPLHGPILPEDYLALVTMHGTLMLFFVMTVAPQSGFGNLILPAQIGARRMAFPRLNAAGLWLSAFALLTLLAAFFVPAGAPLSGWTSYPPLSATPLAGPGQGIGMDLWLASIALFAIASTMGAVNTLTTIVKLRGEGMTWIRLPLTVWAWFTAALLAILAFSVLLAAILLLVCDRHLHTGFFLPAQELVNGTLLPHTGDGSPLLWLHLFWFFGHPEVYIAILPGMGLTSMVLANFARRPVFAYRLMIATTLLIGLLGIVVWGHHMFVAGLNPFAGSAPMLWALGFVSLFITGGLSGPILAQPILDEYLHNTFFVVAHFHLIMAMAGVFGLFCATYYWFPLVFHRTLSESLGKLHFWGTFLGAYATFLPMHLAGLAGESRHYAQLTGPSVAANALLARAVPIQTHVTYGAFFTVLAQLPFVLAVLKAWLSRVPAEPNPWLATTMEWAPTPTDPESPEPAMVYRGPCHYAEDGSSMKPQWEPPPTSLSEPE